MIHGATGGGGGGGGGGANVHLSNLAAVAVNLALTPGTDIAIALNSTAKRYTSAYFNTSVELYAGAANAADANPKSLLGLSRIDFGPGGATAVDTSIVRGAAGGLTYTAKVLNAGTNVAHTFDNGLALSGTTLLASFRSNAVEKTSIEDDGTVVAAGVKLGTGQNSYYGYSSGLMLGGPDGTANPTIWFNRGSGTLLDLMTDASNNYGVRLNGKNGGMRSVGGFSVEPTALLCVDGSDGTIGDSGLRKTVASGGTMALDYDGTTFLSYDGSATNIKGGLQLTTPRQATSNSNIVASDVTVSFDTSSGNLTATLLASPNDGEIHNIVHTAGANTLTVDGNGKNLMGSATILVLLGQAVQIQYSAAEGQWLIL